MSHRFVRAARLVPDPSSLSDLQKNGQILKQMESPRAFFDMSLKELNRILLLRGAQLCAMRNDLGIRDETVGRSLWNAKFSSSAAAT
jgi:hypothetical protein